MSAHRARPLPSDWMHRHQWVSPQGRPAWPARRCSPEVADARPAPAEACTEVGQDDGQPLTAREALIFWLTVCAPSIGGVALMALVLWVTKP